MTDGKLIELKIGGLARLASAMVVTSVCWQAPGADREGSAWTVAESNDFHAVVVGNANARRTAEGIGCRWTVLHNGEPFAAGGFDLKGLAPGKSHVYEMPKAFAAAGLKGGALSLRLRFAESKNRRENVLAVRQLDWTDPVEDYVPQSCQAIAESGDAATVELSTDVVAYSFSRSTGMLSAMRRPGLIFDTSLLSAPMALSADGVALASRVESMSPVVRVGDRATFRTQARAAAKDLELFVTQDWTLFADGALACRSRIRRLDGRPLPERVGYRFAFDVSNPDLDYFAADPLLGRQTCETAALCARKDAVRRTRALAVRDGSYQVGFAAVGRSFAFAAEAARPSAALVLLPDAVGDRRRPLQLDFMIGPRRFANVVGVN